MKICVLRSNKFASAFMQALSIYNIDFDIVGDEECKNYDIVIPLRLSPKYSLLFGTVLENNSPLRWLRAKILDFQNHYYEFPHYLASRLGMEELRKNIWPEDFDSAFSVSFDCDFSRDYPKVKELLEILGRFDMKASFACVGQLVNKENQVYQAIIDKGHEIINHTQNHPSNSETCPCVKY